MAENMIKFLRGNVVSLPQTATAGAVYFTKDEGLYLGLEDGSYHRYGDFITVENVAALPTTGAHETCMYYCESENILAKWDGEEWVQINKQKTLEQLGGVAKSVYEAKMAALEKADSDNATAISGVDTRLQTAEGEIDVLQAAIGENGSVTNAIAAAQSKAEQGVSDAAAALAKANEKTTMAEVEAKGYATQDEAKGYADAKDEAIAAAKKAGDDAAVAAGVADGKAVQAQKEIDALEELVGVLPETATATDVIGYIQEKTAGIATEGAMTELGNRVTQAEKDIDAIEADYLKGADKTELEGKITAVETAVATEKSRAEGIESGLADRIKAVEDDYLKAEDKTELQGNIDTLTGVVEALRDGVDAEKVDGVLDLINYVEEHGPEVAGMKEDIADNAEAIEAVAGRMDDAEDAIEALEGAVATKAEKTYVDGKIEALEGVDAGFETRIAAVEGKLGTGEGSVDAKIATAKQEAIDAAASAADTKDEAVLAAAKKYADDEDAKIESRVDALETASATHALKSDLEGVSGRVTVVEGKVGTLETEMDAVEAKAAANESAIGTLNTTVAGKAAQADLEALAQTHGTDKAALEASIATKANAADVYAKTETFNKSEVEALLQWGSF